MFVLMNKERTYSISSCTLLGSLLPVSDWRIFSPGPMEGSYLMQFQRATCGMTFGIVPFVSRRFVFFFFFYSL
ncbi:hypothetical protein AHAS_Ahas16G0158600 [Arachis hypogaea]